jgi:hypothetical protein
MFQALFLYRSKIRLYCLKRPTLFVLMTEELSFDESRLINSRPTM